MYLRPYQTDGAAQIRAAYRSGAKRVLYQLATGAGKTLVFSHIVAAAAARGRRVWLLVPGRETVLQASRKLTDAGVRHGLIKAGFTPDPLAPVQVLAAQTAIRRLSALPPADLVIIDEAHHATAKTYRTLLDARPDAFLLGVTATPARTDGTGLGVLFDRLICGPPMADLIAQGYLAPFDYYAPPVVADFDGVTVRAGDYAQGELAERVDRPTVTGDAVAHYARLCPGQPALAFCASVKHAEHVAAQFTAAGYPFASLDGAMPDAQRAGLLADLAAGRLAGLASCSVISEGFDCPGVVAAILLRKTCSVIVYLQQVGRALRPGKPRAIILDHVGNATTHGLPDDPRAWSLDGTRTAGAGPRQSLAPMRQCATCYACFRPAPVCPHCGAPVQAESRMPEQAEGELQRVDAAERARLRLEREAAARLRRREEGQARDLAALQDLGRRRGYAPQWATIRWQMRQRQRRRVTA